MFTGLVEGMGEVVRIHPGSEETRLSIRALFPLSSSSSFFASGSPSFSMSGGHASPAAGWTRGESVAVNGACLSVETFDGPLFTAYASAETLSLTNLRFLSVGDRVNLERALALGARLGGHLVSGHVDGQAALESLNPVGASLRLGVRFPKEFSAQVVAKGSVALDGVSLTVNRCSSDFLEVNVIPETCAATTVGDWRPGRALNFESDLIGKYVQRMLGAFNDRDDTRDTASRPPADSRLSMDFLREHGF